MGSGKTSSGKTLARKMDFDFIDLDELIVKKQGRSIAEIFNKEGEKYFRNLESENLKLLERISSTIVSVGGGTPCFNDNMNWMNAEGLTVYLKLDPGAIYMRLKNADKKRPLIAGKSKTEMLEFIHRSLEKREKYYSKAKLIIEAKNLRIDKLMEGIRNSPHFQN